MSPTPQQARAELARRELDKRQYASFQPVQDDRGIGEKLVSGFGQAMTAPLIGAYKIAKPVVQTYGAVREAITEPISELVPNKPMTTYDTVRLDAEPLTKIAMQFGRNIGSGRKPFDYQHGDYLKPRETTTKQATKDLAGMGFDQLATLGLAKGIPSSAKGTDKLLTSILRRIGGKTSGDIKSTRELARGPIEFDPFSKTKAKPQYLGREIAPKATELASRRVRSMEPEALREIGISSEDTALAQRLKQKHGLKEFPTKASADEFYARTRASAPSDAQIPTDSLEKALLNPENRLDSSSMRNISKYLNRTRINELGVTEKVPLSPSEYDKIRGMLNNLDPTGETPAVQAIKSALDSDFGKVVPEIAGAKGRFQLSRQVPKAELYLDKTALGKTIQSKLETATTPKNVEDRLSLKRLLGEKSEPLLKDLEAQRLAKEWYGGPGEGPGVSGRPILDIIKNVLRPLPRGYEKRRSSLINLVKGRKQVSSFQEAPSIASASNPFYSPAQQVSQPVNMDVLRQNVSKYKTPEIKLSDESIRIAQENRIMEAIARGEQPYAGRAGKFQGPEVLPTPEKVPYNYPYKPIEKTSIRKLAKKRGKK